MFLSRLKRRTETGQISTSFTDSEVDNCFSICLTEIKKLAISDNIPQSGRKLNS